jgi:hypothetical protein
VASTPAEVGDGVEGGAVAAGEMAHWATSVTEDQEVVPAVVVRDRARRQPEGSLGGDGSSLPVSGGNEHGSAVAVTAQVPSSESSKARPTRPAPPGAGFGRRGEDGDDVGRGAGSSKGPSKANRGVGK